MNPDRIQHIDTDALRECPENWKIYRRPGITEPEMARLIESIDDQGILSPLEISQDHFVLSGHRRLIAARHLHFQEVPVIVTDVIMGNLSSADRISLLIERNKGQRVKSTEEAILEAAADVDPNEAIRRAQAARSKLFTKSQSCGEEVLARGKSRRSDPAKARREILDAVKGIIAEWRKQTNGSPISSRSIHYQLLQLKVRTSTYSSGFIYGAPGKDSAALLSKLVTDARSFGEIDPEWISDDTRSCMACSPMAVGDYVVEEADGLFLNYFSDIHRDQPAHVELLLEKNTLFHLLHQHVAHPLRVPITSMHGYGSFPVARDVAKRFRESGKADLVVVYVSDHDPEGMNMPEAFTKYLKEDFGVTCTMRKAAVTQSQVEKYRLPPDADVKLSSSRAEEFIRRYGNECWELDSMPPKALIHEVSEVVRAQLDIDVLNRAFDQERDEDIKLARLNAAVQAFIRENAGTIMEGAA